MKPARTISICLAMLLAATLLTGCAAKTPVKAAMPATAADSTDHLRADLDQIFSDAAFADAQWGVEVVSLDRGDVLYAHNPTRLYMPASNNKVLTTVSALLRLGPDYRYETRISADGTIDAGVLKGNLIVTGSGDPSFAPRFHDGDPATVFRGWAAKLKEQGIRSIEGEIVADGRAFPPPWVGRGWEWDDLDYGYAAPVSALQFNENLYSIEVIPGEVEGTLATVACKPVADYVTIDASVSTIAPGERGRIQIRRGERHDSIIVTGTIAAGAKPYTATRAVESPDLYFAAALRQTLREEGIGTSQAQVRTLDAADPSPPVPGTLLWSHSSPTLAVIMKPLLKVSQNLYAETLVRTLGLVLRGQGRFDSGREVVEETLDGMAIPPGTYAYVDGSGLSRQNLVSAEILTRIFKYMYRQKDFPLFYDALPIAGVDGTIRDRLKGTKGENNVHGKTGTIAYVRCLSGYIKTAEGEMLAFAMIANNFLASNRAAEYVQDSALDRLANFRRSPALGSVTQVAGKTVASQRMQRHR